MKRFLWLPLTIFLLCSLVGVTSCSLDDDPTPVPQPDVPLSKWFPTSTGPIFIPSNKSIWTSIATQGKRCGILWLSSMQLRAIASSTSQNEATLRSLKRVTPSFPLPPQVHIATSSLATMNGTPQCSTKSEKVTNNRSIPHAWGCAHCSRLILGVISSSSELIHQPWCPSEE